jgi:glycosyltransferase involved in cell wall biosynthesis
MSKKGKPTPRVSVVIPTYNRGRMVCEAIDSVLAQDFPAYELIVVDDGSSDDTRRVLAGYGARIRVLQRPHRGVSAARNAGIQAARTELIALLDSDDLWLPAKLTRQVAYLDARPEEAIVQTEEVWVRNGHHVKPKKKHRKPAGDIFARSLELCLVSPSAVMIRKRLLAEVGLFDESLPACEDYDLWLRISCRHPVGLIPEPLIVKRGGHVDQLSRAPGLDRYRIAALRKLLDQGVLTPQQASAAAAVLIEKCGVYAGGCRKRGRLAEARAYEELAGETMRSVAGLRPVQRS